MRIRQNIALLLFFFAATIAVAQSNTGTLRGRVTDPSGAVVVGAQVYITPAGGQPITAVTNREGVFEVRGLAAGKYKIQATANGFALLEKDNVEVKAGQIKEADLELVIEAKQQVQVNASAPTLDVNPANNAGAIDLKGKDLDALPDDPDELSQDLQALAGPAAGPNGGQMYIDGFTAGQLPPKSAIREIRINSNPFSTEYDKLGYARIEIFTKAGTDKFHGSGMVQGNDSAFNSRNPFATSEPPYHSVMFNGTLSGPLSKKASFFVSGFRRNINNVTVLNTCVLSNDTNPQLFGATHQTDITPRAGTTTDLCSNQTISGIVPFTASVPSPRNMYNIGPRVDYQLTKNNTLTGRYQYWRNDTNDELGGALDVPTQAMDTLNTEQTLQISDSQIIGNSIVNDSRFQYLHESSSEIPFSNLPTVDVLGAFNAGGNNSQTVLDTTEHYEFQNNTALEHGKHSLNFGLRVRRVNDDSSATSNFAGRFSFKSLASYQITEQNILNGQPANACQGPNGTNCGGANQFSITIGSPQTSVAWTDAAFYIQDDWRIRPNITISPGLRFETQSAINDHADWAPRLAFAWGIGGGKTGHPSTVLRAGTGIFYDRFEESELAQVARLNGVTQQQYVLQPPPPPQPTPPGGSPGISCFFATALPQPVTLAEVQAQCPGGSLLSTVYRLQPNLRAPGMLQTAVTLERQVSKIATVSVSYINSRGWDQLLTNNINTPLPGTFNSTPVYPFGNPGNIYEFQSEGVYRQNQLFATARVNAGQNLSLFGYYALNYANADTDGANSFPSNPFNISEDYGRAGFDTRHRVFFGGTVGAPYGLRFSPFMVLSSGRPYNITISQDLIGSSQFNQRPTFASALSDPANVVVTSLGAFDTVPQPGETLVPINFGTGPSQFTFNLRVAKSFSFGRAKESASQPRGEFGGGGPRGGGGGGRGGGGRMVMMGGGGPFNRNAPSGRYNLTFSVDGRNIFNKVNPSAPTGVLGSPLFGKSNNLGGGAFSSASANRVIDLQANFSF